MSRKRAIPAVTAPLEDELLSPRRFRLRHVVLAALVLAGVLAGVRLWWGWHAGRRLDAAVAELRAKGEPVAEEDFARPPVPDERNAAFYLRRAAANFRMSREQAEDERREDFYFPPLSPEAVASMGALLEDNRGALADVRRARGLAAADWGPPPRSLVQSDWMPFLLELSAQRGLAKRLSYGVWHAHRTGNHAEAVERLRDMLGVSRALKPRGDLTAHFVALGISAMAAEEAKTVVAGDLRVGDAPPAAARQQVKALIAELLDDRDLRPGLVHAIRSERPFLLLFASRYDFRRSGPARGPDRDEHGLEWTPPWLNTLVTAAARPAAVLHVSRSLRESAQNVAAAEAIDPASPFPTGAFLAPPRPPGIDMFGVAYVADLGSTDLRHVPQQHAMVMASRTAAAQALAVRLFRLDHGRPPGAAELVPEYLPYVPPYQRLLPPLPGAPPATAPATGPAA
jgi:hypothetical protein